MGQLCSRFPVFKLDQRVRHRGVGIPPRTHSLVGKQFGRMPSRITMLTSGKSVENIVSCGGRGWQRKMESQGACSKFSCPRRHSQARVHGCNHSRSFGRLALASINCNWQLLQPPCPALPLPQACERVVRLLSSVFLGVYDFTSPADRGRVSRPVADSGGLVTPFQCRWWRSALAEMLAKRLAFADPPQLRSGG